MRQLLEVARMYHVEKLSQQEISEQLGLSRPKVSRILSEAEEQGIIQVTIVDPTRDTAELAQRLIDQFGLKDALVADTVGLSGAKAFEQLGKAGADYLVRLLNPQDVLGVAWGRTTMEIARQMPEWPVREMTVASLIGCPYDNTPDEDVFEVARMLSRKLQASLHLLYTPVIVSSPEARDVYLSDRHTAEAMRQIDYCNVAICCIGNFWRRGRLYRSGYVTPEKHDELAEKGAVGCVCAHFYDRDGKPVDADLDSRAIAISIDKLKEKAWSIGVAMGLEKVDAITGALKGGLVNVLITESDTAKALLEKASRKKSRRRTAL
jgi:deoxyribonucleoside regulator